MVKIIAIAAVLLCSTLIGLGLLRYYQRRNLFYKEMLLFCERLLTEINFLHTKLGCVIKNEFGSHQVIKEILCEYSRFLNNETDFACFKNYCHKKLIFLSEQERGLILGFFERLGSTDADNENGSIKNYILEFRNKLETTDKDKSKFGGMCVKLSLVAGLMAVIILL